MGAGARKNMLRFVKTNPDMIRALEGKDVFFPVILAIGYGESSFTSSPARLRNNYFGIDNGRKVFSSPKSAFEYQANLYSRGSSYVNLGVTSAKDPYEQLRLIAKGGYYSMDNDGSLGQDPKMRNRLGGAKWNNTKQRWIRPDGSIVKFSTSESQERYYNTIKNYVDDALKAIPVGKITNAEQVIASL